MSALTPLQTIRLRAELENHVTAIDDRRYLLNLVERMRLALEKHGQHGEFCGVTWYAEGDPSRRVCTCGLNALLEELKSE